MKHLLIIFSTFLCAYNLPAQSTERQVLGSAGNTSGTSNMMVSFTIGETFVQTQTSSNILLTAGYQQASDTNTSSIKSLNKNYSLVLFPNPTKGISNLELMTSSSTNIKIIVYSALGAQISSSLAQVLSNTKAGSQIDLTAQAKGVYYVHVLNETNASIQTFKLVKF